MKPWTDDRRRATILRYLSYKGSELSVETEEAITAAIAQVRQVAKPRTSFQKFDIKHTNKGITIKGTNIVLSGEHIARHLKDCNAVILLALTLGIEIDNLLQQETKRDLGTAVVLDAAASQYAEETADEVNTKINDEYAKENLQTIPRFSPGYGDLSLDLQAPILAVLNAQKLLGLTVTESDLLLPQKSITAIIGLK